MIILLLVFVRHVLCLDSVNKPFEKAEQCGKIPAWLIEIDHFRFRWIWSQEVMQVSTRLASHLLHLVEASRNISGLG